MSEIKGKVESVIFQNEDNGYTVAKIYYDKNLVTVTGIIPFIQEGIELKINGEWFVHPQFGEQFKVKACEQILPDTVESIEKYLSSGIISGIGPVTAKKIVKHFGEKTLEIMDTDINKIKEIEGIGKKKAQKIADSYSQQSEIRNIMIFFQTYGLSVNQCVKIHKKYGSEAVNQVKENPYMLIEDIARIGFKTADKIARNLGIDAESKFRIQSGILFSINQFCLKGNTYVPLEILIEEAASILLVDRDLVYKNIIEFATTGKIKIENIDGEEAVFSIPFLHSEIAVTLKMLTLATDEYEDIEINIEQEIKDFEEHNSIEFAPIQREAITGAFKNGVEVITGGPGTGKTTIIKCITEIFENASMTVFMAAPTGRAAKRMSEATGKEAKTIHRLLEIGFKDEESYDFVKGDEDPLQCDVLIVDEASMIDILLMKDLLKALSKGTRLIIVGDADQLPSVGPGNVLSDIIHSESVKVVKLKEIFRQAKESMIVVNAHKINKSEIPLMNTKDTDFFFLNGAGHDNTMQTILELVIKRLPTFKKDIDKIKDIQILTPMRKGTLGTNNLNLKLQEILNPKSQEKREKEFRNTLFREGDKVMQIKNNYSLKWKSVNFEDEGVGVFNGDIGYIKKINDDSVTILFDDDRKVIYENIFVDELELAYAMTIHKSQGSEFPIVVMPMFMGPPMLMNKNLLYTGITRAKKMVVLVGEKKALHFMIKNNNIIERYSGLCYRIKSTINALD